MCCLCGLAEKADDIPDQVTHEVVAAEPPYVLIKWKEPQSPNGLIILYEVFYGKVGDAEVSVDQLLQSVCVCVRALVFISPACVCVFANHVVVVYLPCVYKFICIHGCAI